MLWRIFLANAAVLTVATLALVLSPATVSFPVAAREAVVLGVGLAVMLTVNYVLVRRALTPLERLTDVMRGIDPLAPGRRSGLAGAPAEVGALDQMLDRLETERRDSARRALAAQEDERRRIARELHDEVGQSLTAAMSGIAQIEPRGARRRDADRTGREGCRDDRRPGPAVTATRILLADDHPMVRRGLRMVLDAEPDLTVVAEAGDGAEAVEAALRETIDLAILDVAMPRLTRLDAARELQIVKLIAEAHTSDQIAELLTLSPRTVDRHRENILRKLGMRDRVELTRYAIRRGLVEP